MIKEFEKEVGIVCTAPYVMCFVNNKQFKARVDTGADITVIPNHVLPSGLLLKNPVITRGHSGIIDYEWTKDIGIEIPELGVFRPERGILTTDAPQGLIGMDILNLCELQMIGGVFTLALLEEENE